MTMSGYRLSRLFAGALVLSIAALTSAGCSADDDTQDRAVTWAVVEPSATGLGPDAVARALTPAVATSSVPWILAGSDLVAGTRTAAWWYSSDGRVWSPGVIATANGSAPATSLSSITVVNKTLVAVAETASGRSVYAADISRPSTARLGALAPSATANPPIADISFVATTSKGEALLVGSAVDDGFRTTPIAWRSANGQDWSLAEVEPYGDATEAVALGFSSRPGQDLIMGTAQRDGQSDIAFWRATDATRFAAVSSRVLGGQGDQAAYSAVPWHQGFVVVGTTAVANPSSGGATRLQPASWQAADGEHWAAVHRAPPALSVEATSVRHAVTTKRQIVAIGLAGDRLAMWATDDGDHWNVAAIPTIDGVNDVVLAADDPHLVAVAQTADGPVLLTGERSR
ncbi:MAG: hypothetical protein AB7L13_23115 [Acidimicrobiia bacterium]